MHFIGLKVIVKNFFKNSQLEFHRYISDEKLCNCDKPHSIDQHYHFEASSNSFLRGSEK